MPRFAILLLCALLAIHSCFSQKTDNSVWADNNKETTLSFSFMDGHGNFFRGTPQLKLLDTGTGKVIKTFYRTVDSLGNPDPQSIASGTYDIQIGGRKDLLMRHIEIAAHKKNIVTVKVANPMGTLHFRYTDVPNRPVKEFDALVSIQDSSAMSSAKQNCTEEREYRPGNYYVEVNTIPVSRFNVDIDWGSITEIQINEPGFLSLHCNMVSGPIPLYYQLGNKFVAFRNIQPTTSDKQDKTPLRPGVYEAHWKDKRGNRKVTRFEIKSNSVTEIEL